MDRGYNVTVSSPRRPKSRDKSDYRAAGSISVAENMGALIDTVIRPSVCPPVRLSVCPSLGYSTLAAWRSCLDYRIDTLAACSWPATRDVQAVDPSADGRRSAASRTAVGGSISSRRPWGDNLF